MWRHRRTLRSAVEVIARHLPALEGGPSLDNDERHDFVRRVCNELASSWSLDSDVSIDESGPLDQLAASLALSSAHAWSDQTGASWVDESLGKAVAEGLGHGRSAIVRLINAKIFVAVLDSELKARSVAESNIRRRDIEFLSASPEHRRDTLRSCFEVRSERRSPLVWMALAASLIVAAAVVSLAIDRDITDHDPADRADQDEPVDDLAGPISSSTSTSISNSSVSSEPVTSTPIRPVPPADGDPPPGDHYRPTRPNSNVGLVMAPGEILVLDVDVDAPGWLLLDLQCEGESRVREWPELDLALSVVADSQPVYWAPPDPATDCHRQLIQGPVEQGHYYYQLQAASTEDEAGNVGVIARYVKAPVDPYWDGRVVVPKIDRRPENSRSGTITPGTVDAYQFELSQSDRLEFNFNCDVERSPDVVPLRVRIVDLDNREVDDRIVDDCVPFSSRVPRNGRYEVQIMAADSGEEVSYRLAALLR